MSLNSLISYISNSQIITELVKRIKNNKELNIIGSSRYAKSINSKLSLLGDQCNTSGAWAMGVVPHRLPGGIEIEDFKNTAYLSSYPENDLLIIYNLEPEYDFSNDTEIIDRLKNSKFLAGEKYTIADIATWPWLARHEWHDIGLKKFINLKRWYEEIAKRDAVQKGYDLLKNGELIPNP